MHLGDWDPFNAQQGIARYRDTYKDSEFVLNEIKNIIKQLKEKQHENF